MADINELILEAYKREQGLLQDAGVDTEKAPTGSINERIMAQYLQENNMHDPGGFGETLMNVGKGVMGGIGGVVESAGGAMEAVGSADQAFMDAIGSQSQSPFTGVGRYVSASGKALRNAFAPPEDIQVDLLESIKEHGMTGSVLSDGDWWAYNIGAVVPSLGVSAAASMTGVGLAGVVGERVMRWSPKAVKLAQAITGLSFAALTDNILVSGDVFHRAKAQGLTDQEAGMKAAEAFVLNTPLALAEATLRVGKIGGKVLESRKQAERMSKFLISAGSSRALAAGVGSLQEGAQEALMNYILDEDITKGVLEGLILGGIAEGTMAVRVSSMNEKLGNLYDVSVDAGRTKLISVLKSQKELREQYAKDDAASRALAEEEAKAQAEDEPPKTREDRQRELDEAFNPEIQQALEDVFSPENPELKNILTRVAKKEGFTDEELEGMSVLEIEDALIEGKAQGEVVEEKADQPARSQVRERTQPEGFGEALAANRKEARRVRQANRDILGTGQTFTGIDLAKGTARQRRSRTTKELKADLIAAGTEIGTVPLETVESLQKQRNDGDITPTEYEERLGRHQRAASAQLVDFAVEKGINEEDIIVLEGNLFADLLDKRGIPTVDGRSGEPLSFENRRSRAKDKGITMESVLPERDRIIKRWLRDRDIPTQGIQRIVEAIQRNPVGLDMLDGMTKSELLDVAKTINFGSKKKSLLQGTKQQIAARIRKRIRDNMKSARMVPAGIPPAIDPTFTETVFGIAQTEEEIRTQREIDLANMTGAPTPAVGREPESVAAETRLAQVPPIRDGQDESISLEQLMAGGATTTVIAEGDPPLRQLDYEFNKLSDKGLAATYKRFNLQRGKLDREGMIGQLDSLRGTLKVANEKGRRRLQGMHKTRLQVAARFLGIRNAKRKTKALLINEIVEKGNRILGDGTKQPVSFLPETGRVAQRDRRGRAPIRHSEGGFGQAVGPYGEDGPQRIPDPRVREPQPVKDILPSQVEAHHRRGNAGKNLIPSLRNQPPEWADDARYAVVNDRTGEVVSFYVRGEEDMAQETASYMSQGGEHPASLEVSDDHFSVMRVNRNYKVGDPEFLPLRGDDFQQDVGPYGEDPLFGETPPVIPEPVEVGTRMEVKDKIEQAKRAFGGRPITSEAQVRNELEAALQDDRILNRLSSVLDITDELRFVNDGDDYLGQVRTFVEGVFKHNTIGGLTKILKRYRLAPGQMMEGLRRDLARDVGEEYLPDKGPDVPEYRRSDFQQDVGPYGENEFEPDDYLRVVNPSISDVVVALQEEEASLLDRPQHDEKDAEYDAQLYFQTFKTADGGDFTVVTKPLNIDDDVANGRVEGMVDFDADNPLESALINSSALQKHQRDKNIRLIADIASRNKDYDPRYERPIASGHITRRDGKVVAYHDGGSVISNLDFVDENRRYDDEDGRFRTLTPNVGHMEQWVKFQLPQDKRDRNDQVRGGMPVVRNGIVVDFAGHFEVNGERQEHYNIMWWDADQRDHTDLVPRSDILGIQQDSPRAGPSDFNVQSLDEIQNAISATLADRHLTGKRKDLTSLARKAGISMRGSTSVVRRRVQDFRENLLLLTEQTEDSLAGFSETYREEIASAIGASDTSPATLLATARTKTQQLLGQTAQRSRQRQQAREDILPTGLPPSQPLATRPVREEAPPLPSDEMIEQEEAMASEFGEPLATTPVDDILPAQPAPRPTPPGAPISQAQRPATPPPTPAIPAGTRAIGSVTKIISGGQDGADRAALDFAIANGMEAGGWVPKGRITESGPLPANYPVREMSSRSYPARTAKNVEDSDGTVIFSRTHRLTRGANLTRKTAIEKKKPYLVINLAQTTTSEAASAELLNFIEAFGIQTLNVSGTRASNAPELAPFVTQTLTHAIGDTPAPNARDAMNQARPASEVTDTQVSMPGQQYNPFPRQFFIQGSPDPVRVNMRNSFFEGGYGFRYQIEALQNGQWVAFSKGTEEEIKAQMVDQAPAPLPDTPAQTSPVEDILPTQPQQQAVPDDGLGGTPLATTPVTPVEETPAKPTQQVPEPPAPEQRQPAESPQPQEPILDKVDRFIDAYISPDRDVQLPEGLVPDQNPDPKKYEDDLADAKTPSDVSRIYAQNVLGMHEEPVEAWDEIIDDSIRGPMESEGMNPDEINAALADGPTRQAMYLKALQVEIDYSRNLADAALERIQGSRATHAPETLPPVRVIPEGVGITGDEVIRREDIEAIQDEEAEAVEVEVQVVDLPVAVPKPSLLDDGDLIDMNIQTMERVTALMSLAQTERDVLYIARAFRRSYIGNNIDEVFERARALSDAGEDVSATAFVDFGTLGRIGLGWNQIVAMGSEKMGITPQEFVDKVATFHRATTKRVPRRIDLNKKPIISELPTDAPTAPEPSIELDHDIFVANVFENLILGAKDADTLLRNAEHIRRMQRAFQPNEFKSLISHVDKRIADINRREAKALEQRLSLREHHRDQGPEQPTKVKKSSHFNQGRSRGMGMEQRVGGYGEARYPDTTLMDRKVLSDVKREVMTNAPGDVTYRVIYYPDTNKAYIGDANRNIHWELARDAERAGETGGEYYSYFLIHDQRSFTLSWGDKPIVVADEYNAHQADSLAFARTIGAEWRGPISYSDARREGLFEAFVGSQARTANRNQLIRATEMEAEGSTPQEIWRETMWFKGADGRWRFEISDKDIAFRVDWDNYAEQSGLFLVKEDGDAKKLNEVISHPQLFEAYPQLKDITVKKRKKFMDIFGSAQGWYNPKTKELVITPNADNPMQVLIHEVQHAVQYIESFAAGGNLETIIDIVPQEEIDRAVGSATQALADDAQTETLKADEIERLSNEYAQPLQEHYELALREDQAYRTWEDNGSVSGDRFSKAWLALTKEVSELEKALRQKMYGTEDYFALSREQRDIFNTLTRSGSYKDGTAVPHADRLIDDVSKMRESAQKKVDKLNEIKSGDKEVIESLLRSSGDIHNFYERLSGEVEARNVSRRFDKGARGFPRGTEDRTQGEQFVRFPTADELSTSESFTGDDMDAMANRTRDRMRQEAKNARPSGPEARQTAINNLNDIDDADIYGYDTAPAPEGRTLAAMILADTAEGKVIHLKGEKIESKLDLAIAGQLFRDPHVETLRFVFIKDGEVVDGISMSSRLPDNVSDFFIDEALIKETEDRVRKGQLTRDQADDIYDHVRISNFSEIQNAMEASGADGYYLLHNHPNGNPIPSGFEITGPDGQVLDPEYGDMKATRNMAEAIPGFLGHVIIDDFEYGFIDADFNFGTNDLPSAVATGNLTRHPISDPQERAAARMAAEMGGTVQDRAIASLGRKVRDHKDIAERGEVLNMPSAAIPLFFVNASNDINAVYEMTLEELFEADVESKLKDMAARHGAGRIIGYYSNDIDEHPQLQLAIKHLREEGYLFDFVYNKKGSPVNIQETMPVVDGKRFGLPAHAIRFEQKRKILPGHIPDVVEADLIESGKGIHRREGLFERLSGWMENIRVGLGREFEHIPRATTKEAKRRAKEKGISVNEARKELGIFGPLRARLNQMLKGREISRDKAARFLAETRTRLTPENLNLTEEEMLVVDWKIIHDDLIAESESDRPLFDLDGNGPFHHTEASLKATHKWLTEEVAKSPAMTEAIENRNSMMDLMREEMIAAWKPFGIDLSSRFTNKNYFRHQVLFYYRAVNGGSLATPSKLPSLRSRSGLTGLNINTNYVEAEGEVVAGMMYSMQVAQVLKYVKDNFDQSDTVREIARENNISLAQATRMVLPDHELYRVDGRKRGRRGYPNVLYMGKPASEAIIEGNALASIEASGIEESAMEDLESEMSEHPLLVVPHEVAATLNGLENHSPTLKIARAYHRYVSFFKANMLVGVHRFGRYNIRNMVGDTEFTVLGNAGIFSPKNGRWKVIPKAGKELWDVFLFNREPTPNLSKFMEIGGLREMLLSQELMDEDSMAAEYRILTGQESLRENLLGNTLRHPIKTYFSIAGRLSNTREAWLRYANFLDFKAQMEQDPSGNGRPKSFGASIPEEVMAEPDLDRRAFKLSNDLLGAYDEVSVAGKFMRRNLLWFWSFTETAMRRYRQLADNAWRGQGDSIAGKMGKAMLGGTIAAEAIGASVIRLGIFGLKAHFLFGALAAFNYWNAPEEEEELTDQVRRRPHITGKKDENGNIDYFSRLGSLQEVLEWFGLDDWPYDVIDLMNGRRTLEEVAYDSYTAIPSKIINASRADIKTMAELALRVQSFPDPFNPRLVRDRGLHLARSLGLEDEYRWASDLPSRKAKDILKSQYSYTINANQAGYRDVYDDVNRWLARRGESTLNHHLNAKSTALYRLKESKRLGDTEAETVWLSRYIATGGDINGMRRAFEALAPLAGLSNQQSLEYRAQLTKRGRERLGRALAWYNDTLIGEDGVEGIVRDALPYLQSVTEPDDMGQFLRRSLTDAVDYDIRSILTPEGSDRRAEFTRRSESIRRTLADILGELEPRHLVGFVGNERQRGSVESTIRRQARGRILDEILGLTNEAEP